MNYEETARSANVVSDDIRRHFRSRERHQRNVRLMFMIGAGLAIAAAVVIILHDLKVF